MDRIRADYSDIFARCQETFGLYSHVYIVGLVTVGEVHMRTGNLEEAISYFSRALSFTERIHGHHPYAIVCPACC